MVKSNKTNDSSWVARMKSKGNTHAFGESADVYSKYRISMAVPQEPGNNAPSRSAIPFWGIYPKNT